MTLTADTASYSGPRAADGAAASAEPRAPLPFRYYLGHFLEVIAGVRARYDFLLNEQERQHLETVEALTEPARMLYARLVNRRGPCFRLDRLAYPEIGVLDLPIAELLSTGLLEICDESFDAARRARLFACFTHRELKAHLLTHGPPKHTRKGELLTWLAAWDQCSTWLAKFLAEHAVLRIPRADPWPFLRFLFFGELRDNLSDFVTNALGHVVTERIDAHQLIAHFTSRDQAEDAYHLEALYVEFRAIRDTQTAVQTLGWWHAQAIDRTLLRAGTEWFDRIVDRLGRLLERETQPHAARLYTKRARWPQRANGWRACS